MRTPLANGRARGARQGSRPQPQLADLGLHRLTALLLAFQLCAAVVVAWLFSVMGLSADWRGASSLLLMDSILVGVWIYLWRVPGRPSEWAAAESVLAMLLTIGLTHVLTPAQYVAVAFDRPLIDPVLAKIDAFMGIDVPSLVRWSREHPGIDLVLRLAYSSFIVQLVLIPPIVAMILRDRRALWDERLQFSFLWRGDRYLSGDLSGGVCVSVLWIRLHHQSNAVHRALQRLARWILYDGSFYRHGGSDFDAVLSRGRGSDGDLVGATAPEGPGSSAPGQWALDPVDRDDGRTLCGGLPRHGGHVYGKRSSLAPMGSGVARSRINDT